MGSHSDTIADPKRRQGEAGPSGSDMSMMRIAVAGTGGLARLIAYYIDQETGHHVVFLSRTEQPQISESFQVTVVDYNNMQSLQYALRGIDTVISTVTGASQIELIKAAVSVRVRRFAPAEFEGPPELRSANDPLDRGRTVARQWLAYYSSQIQSTAFVCGILYERFQPGGLRQSRIGLTSGLSGEGDYIMNCRTMAAQVPCYDANQDPNVAICLTAAQDVGRFVTKALDLPRWPPELRMCGQRVAVRDLVLLVQRLTGRHFNPVEWHNPESLRSEMQVATLRQDRGRQIRLHALIATTEGRYDFTQANLNRHFPNVRTTSFQDWFVTKWQLQGGAGA